MKKTKKSKNKYDIQFAVAGTFLDVLKASASAANKKVKKQQPKDLLGAEFDRLDKIFQEKLGKYKKDFKKSSQLELLKAIDNFTKYLKSK